VTLDVLRGKNVSNFYQVLKLAMFLVHLILPIVLEKHCSRVPELQEESVVEHHNA
jgi:hypothetical protein